MGEVGSCRKHQGIGHRTHFCVLKNLKPGDRDSYPPYQYSLPGNFFKNRVDPLEYAGVGKNDGTLNVGY